MRKERTIGRNCISSPIFGIFFFIIYITCYLYFFQNRIYYIDSRFWRVKRIRRVSNILGAVKYAKCKPGEEIPRRKVACDRTKLKSRRSCGYRFLYKNTSLLLHHDKKNYTTTLLTFEKNIHILQLRYIVFSKTFKYKLF